MNDTGALTVQDSWDPLESKSDPGIVVAAQRREIRNILRSYTGYYDLFAELCQNALDAVERRVEEGERGYLPSIWIDIDLQQGRVSVTDNGCGMSEDQFRQFLRPSFSFKDGRRSRGSKGVGATYLAYGFNHLEVCTKHGDRMFAGVIKNGREWVEDTSETVTRPRVELTSPSHPPFASIDRGASMVVQLVGNSIRPRNLGWIAADTANKWLALLRVQTPIGGIYIGGPTATKININVRVLDEHGSETTSCIDEPRYLYPNEVMSRVVDLREFLAEQKRRIENGNDVSKIPAKYRGLHGI
jgi:hypothetical protein